MSNDLLDPYEVVIGLEVHTHLRTESKLFSPAPVRYGEEPNHSIHPIDIGLPGVLPVLNERVLELAIRLGLATHSTINLRSVFSRKNYFYPDLPKGYQISQYQEPIVSDGWLEIEVPKETDGKGGKKGKKTAPEMVTRRIGITRAHLEEDAGKSIHDSAVAGADDTLIDLNRAGVPLLEIVSEPDLRSPVEAGAYLRALRAILRYLGVSDADMEKGQFRCDANVSLRPKGQQEFGTRTELKNINSFAFVEAAIRAEMARQAEILEDGGEIVQATMAYDPDTRRTRVLRLKENADDYRYFDDPDLIPIALSEEQIEEVRAAMPELPDEKRVRFIESYDLSSQDARLLTESRSLADFFEQTVDACEKANARAISNWVVRDVLRSLNEAGLEIEDCKLDPGSFAKLLDLVEDGKLTAKSGREVFPVLFEEGGDPETIMRDRGLEAMSDSGAIEAMVDEVIAANPESVERIRGGDEKPLNFLMGQVMKKSQGKANPGQIRSLLSAKLSG